MILINNKKESLISLITDQITDQIRAILLSFKDGLRNVYLLLENKFDDFGFKCKMKLIELPKPLATGEIDPSLHLWLCLASDSDCEPTEVSKLEETITVVTDI